MSASTPDRPEPEPRRSTLFNTSSQHLPSSPLVRLMRWWIPAGLCLLGLILLVADDFNALGVDAFAAFAGAGSSMWLINFLWRLGISGDEERDLEAVDRVYLQQHGHWPDEEPAASPRPSTSSAAPPDRSGSHPEPSGPR